VVPVIADLWQQVEHLLLVPPSLPAMLTAAVLAVALVAIATTVAEVSRLAPAPAIHSVATSRERSARVVMTWQRDPDADGHVRPRAPSAAPAVG
jgi:hypothetical protein